MKNQPKRETPRNTTHLLEGLKSGLFNVLIIFEISWHKSQFATCLVKFQLLLVVPFKVAPAALQVRHSRRRNGVGIQLVGRHVFKFHLRHFVPPPGLPVLGIVEVGEPQAGHRTQPLVSQTSVDNHRAILERHSGRRFLKFDGFVNSKA